MTYLPNIDIFKAIGMLFVISGHVFVSDKVYSLYIHSFHIPLFFFVSGYLFHNAEIKTYVLKKLKRLIFPYFMYGIVILLLCVLLFSDFNYNKYIKSFLFFNNFPDIPVAGALWFLTSLFFANIIFYLLNKFVPKYTIIPIIILASAEMFFKIKLPYSIDSAICMLPVLYFGFLFKNNKFRFNICQELFIALFILIASLYTIFLNGDVNVRTNIYSNPVLFYFNAIIVSVGYYYLSDVISKIKYSNILGLIGVYSLEFMCIHQFVLKIIKMYQSNHCIIFIMTLFVTALFVYLINIFLYIKNKFIRN